MFKKQSINKRDTFAVNHGDHAGQMFIVVDLDSETVNCLAIPDMKNVKVPIEAFEHGRKTDIISYVELLSKDIFKVVKSQYVKNENTNN